MAEKVLRVIDYTAELKLLREGDRSLELFKRIVDKAMPRLEVIEKLHDRYTQDEVPVLSREISDPMNIDNRLANDYFGEIIDTKVGYFSGNPMNFAFGDGDEKAQEYFDFIATRNRLDDINSETTKDCAIGGYAARLVYMRNYINTEGKEDTFEGIRQVNTWQVICISEDGIDEPEYAIRIFTTQDEEGESKQALEFYEPFKTTYYMGDDIEKLEEVDVLNHDIGVCNLFCYENNAELQGDAEKVLTLIDDMDRVMSDRSSELEAYRSAYLVFFGVDPDSVDEAELSNSGALYFKNNTDCQQSAQFVTKQLPHEALEAHANRIEDNIYRFSKTPNMNEKKTGIAVSGLALQQRMLPLENKTASFERKFVSGNIRMLECLNYTFTARGFGFDPYAVEQSFTRNTPDDFEYEAEVLERLLQIMPPEKAYALTTFAKDHKELAKWYEEKQQKENDAYELGGEDIGSDGQVFDGAATASEQSKQEVAQ